MKTQRQIELVSTINSEDLKKYEYVLAYECPLGDNKEKEFQCVRRCITTGEKIFICPAAKEIKHISLTVECDFEKVLKNEGKDVYNNFINKSQEKRTYRVKDRNGKVIPSEKRNSPKDKTKEAGNKRSPGRFEAPRTAIR